MHFRVKNVGTPKRYSLLVRDEEERELHTIFGDPGSLYGRGGTVAQQLYGIDAAPSRFSNCTLPAIFIFKLKSMGTKVPAWQSYRDLPYRRQMIARLIKHRSSVGSPLHQKVPHLAKKVELVLYRNAHSLDEYRDGKTMERRVQALVTHMYTKIAGGNKRQLEMPDLVKPVKRSKSGVEDSVFILGNQLDLIKMVYSYLDGADAYRHRGVNRYASRHLAPLATSISMDVGKVEHLLGQGVIVNIMQQSENLKVLKIVNRASGDADLPTTSTML